MLVEEDKILLKKKEKGFCDITFLSFYRIIFNTFL